MSKYEPLWAHLAALDADRVTLSFDQIAAIASVPLDHSFLTCKKELTAYGWRVGKISMKQQTVLFEKQKEGDTP